MYKSKNSKKIINKDSILAENIRAITPDKKSDDFAYVLTFSINTQHSNLVQKINIVSVTPDAFQHTFSNMFLDKTTSLTSYSKEENDVLSDKLSSNLAKNIFYNYHTKNSDTNSISRTISFENRNLHQDAYNLIIPVDFSKLLKSRSCQNIRMFFLDENENILDESGIINVNFQNVYSNNLDIDKELFFNEIFSKQISRTLDINFTSGNSVAEEFIIIDGEVLSILDNEIFSAISAEVSYKNVTIATKKLELNKIITSNILITLYKVDDTITQNSYFRPKSGIQLFDFYDRICNDSAFDEVKDFEFSLKLNIFSNTQKFVIQKNIIKSKNSSFIKNLLNRRLIYSLIKSMPSSGVSITSNFLEDRIQTNLKLTGKGWKKALKSSILRDRRFVIKDIKINNTSVEIYRDIETNIENKINYKEKSLGSFMLDNSLTFYTRNILQDEINVSIVLFFSFNGKEITRTINTGALVRQESKYNLNSINKTIFLNSNKILSDNILVSRTRFNKTLKDENYSIFSYDNINLRNVKDFNEIAYLAGYIDGTQGDVREFLKNAIFKIKNKTEIAETNFKNTTCNYFFGEVLFDFSTFEQDSIEIRNSSGSDIIDKILTNDFEVIERVFAGLDFTKIRSFFKSTDEKNEADIISKISDLSVTNTLEITVFPLIKSISLFKGLGLNNDKNPISSIYEDEAIRKNDIAIDGTKELVLKEIRKRINLDIFNTFYSDRPFLNIRLLEDFKTVIFDPEASNVPKRLDNLFEKIIKSVSNSNRFIQTTKYNKSSIINTFSFKNNFLENSMLYGTLEEGFIRRYYDFQKKENEFFLRDIDYDVVFRENVFNRENNSHSPKKIQIFKPIDKNSLLIDITSSARFFENSQIQNLERNETKVRIGLHFPLRNKNKNLVSNIIDENDKYNIVNIEGNNYITYNEKYVEENNEKFSNLFNGLPSSSTELVIEGNKYFIKINNTNSLLNLNRLNITSYKDFFDFCFSKNAFYLDFCLLRISVSFKVQGIQKFVFSIFEQKVPFKNLNNKNIDMRRVTQITSNIVT